MRLIAVLSLLAAFAAAKPVPDTPYVVHEKRLYRPARWAKSGNPVDSNQVLKMRIGLKQQNLDSFDEMLMRVSDPRSEHYGQHYSPAEVVAMFAPSKEGTTAVYDWLVNTGIPEQRISLSSNRGWLDFEASVAEAEELLRTKYHHYESMSGKERLAVDDYSVPVHVQPYVDLIFPTLHFDHDVSKPIVVDMQPEAKANMFEKRSLKPHVHLGGAIPATVTGTASTASVIGSASASVSAAPPVDTGIPSANISADSVNDCATYVTPLCLRTLYNFFPGNFTVNPNNSFGIVEYGNLSYLVRDDLDNFMSKFVPNATNYNVSLNLIDGAILNETTIASVNNTANFGLHGEANLDVEYGLALSYPQNIVYYQVGNTSNADGFNNFLDAIDGSYCTYDGGDDTKNNSGIFFDNPSFNKSQCGAFPLSKVISTSYGSDEIDMTAAYEQRQCYEFGKLGMMGVSVFFSSGDSGVASNSGCLDPSYGTTFNGSALVSGSIFTNGSYGNFVPGSPVGCGYVTAVGATEIAPGNSVYDKEVTADVALPQSDGSVYQYSSGGGFSNVFEAPSYQKSVVSSWIQTHGNSSDQPPMSRYNSSGTSRGYPDISANGANFTILLGGEYNYVFGTSASCPVAAAIFSVINNERLNAGKSSLGFINPTIYQNSDAFNDIVTGNNPGCGTQGFSATTGWDPNTGLGTPDYQKLRKVFMNLS